VIYRSHAIKSDVGAGCIISLLRSSMPGLEVALSQLSRERGIFGLGVLSIVILAYTDGRYGAR